MTKSPPAIQITGLTKIFRRGLFAAPVTALDHLDLTVHTGEIFGYLGPNGAGKTTTIRLMLNLLHPTEGTCRILGRSVQRSSTSIKNLIGNLPSELRLWEHMTGGEIIEYLARLRPGCDTTYAYQIAERLRVKLTVPVGEFSTGNKRKIGIIQALMHKPELVIMDEPTSGLDPLMRRVLADLLLDVRGEGRTVFLSSHVLSEVQSICDRVAILRKGRLQKVESVHNLTDQRWISITTSDVIDASALSGLDEVDEVMLTTSGCRLRVSGSLDPLIKLLANYQITDLRTEEVSLEDTFMDIYSESE